MPLFVRPPSAFFFLAALSLLLAPFARAQSSGVVVNEILYDPGASDEFIELYNRSDEAIDLSTLRFSDSRRNPVSITEEETPLEPGAYAVLVRDGEAFASAFPDVDFIEPPSWPQLNNSGDTVVLYDADGEVVEEVAYEGGLDEVSLERIDPDGPSNAEVNFAASTAPEGATPGAQNSVFAVDETPPTLDAVAVSESGTALTATFSEALDPASVSAERFALRPGSAPAITAAAPDPDDAARVQITLSAALAPGTYTLAAEGLRDLRGNTLDEESTQSFSFVGEADAPDPRDVVINEIAYAPPETDGEFVELLNRSEKTFDLSQFAFADERGEAVPVTDAPTRLAPGEYAVLVRDAEVFAQRFPGVEAVEVSSWPALNNEGDRPALLFEGELIDAVPYTSGWGGGGGATLERIDPDGPSQSASNFGSSTAPEGGTPGEENSIFAPDAAGPRPVFAEEVAPSTAEVFFSEPLDPASVDASDFTLDGRTPSTATLFENGTGVRLVFADALSGAQLQVSGLRDLTGNALEDAAVPLAYVAAPGELVVNEIMYDPLADDFDNRPNQPEYFELLNTTERALTLSGFFWTDVPDEEGEADTLFFDAARAGVAPGGYAVVHATPDDGPLAEAFPEINFSDPQTTLVPIGRATLSLINSGDLIEVHRADGATLDSVRYDPDWHLEGLEDPTGTSLERIVPGGPSNDPSNWTSSAAPGGGTPGRPNAAALPPEAPPSDAGIAVEPSPFSPDGDGMEDVTAIAYTLSEPASVARVRIYDSYGRQVYENEAELVGRTGQIPWRGVSSDGERLRIGVYVVLFEALDADGGAVERFKAPVVLARPLD